jgi:transcriptional regulator with XRE-family HTH domain
MLDPRQIRAALELVDWTTADLAEATELNADTVRRICRGTIARPHEATEQKIREALERRGVKFLPDCGVQLDDGLVRVFQGEDSYLRLLDEVYHTMHGRGGDVLFFFVDDSLSTPEVVAANKRLRDAGIKCRYLCAESPAQLDFPARDYRAVPERFFHNAVQLVFSNCVAQHFGGESTKVLILRHDAHAESQRRLFEMIWLNSKMPKVT